jgi:Brp/Blh family beta-carotene 15,15'-monooxygenase
MGMVISLVGHRLLFYCCFGSSTRVGVSRLACCHEHIHTMTYHHQYALPALTALSALLPTHTFLDPYLFALCMIIVGIPHGALDHLVYLHSHSLQNQGFSTFQQFLHVSWKDRSFWINFLSFYVGIICLYACLWFLFPLFSLLVFIAFSAFHFGQSHLHYISIPEESWWKAFVYLNWGNAVLMQILLFHYKETSDILAPFVSLETIIGAEQALLLAGVSSGISVSQLVFTYWRFGALSTKDLIAECCGLTSLIILNQQKSLLFSFVVFYGLWHSSESIQIQIGQLGISLRDYAVHCLPFSVISLAGVGFLLKLSEQFNSPILVFFMFLSVLAAPHLVVGQWMYSMMTQSRMLQPKWTRSSSDILVMELHKTCWLRLKQ